MRNFMVFGVCLLLSAVVLQSCGKKETGQLVGVLDRPKWKGINPLGMQYIKSGVFHIGGNDQDIFNSYVQRPRQVSIVGFFMDETEITNNEYRQFVNYVRDSTAHTILGDFIQDDYGNESIDWELPIDYADETLDEMYVSEDDQIFGKREFDNTNLRYAWTEVD
ncbi:MAG: SUMF1/EgtB/PvdO family nonheme iron enzyme, partial [Saprospiraceae bacterium]|nr:SUMF1/EgtB/PvdO family nonheme iron enzyme [Saprospiraceae bacterium]